MPLRSADDMTGTQVARLGLSNAAAATIDRLLLIVSTIDDDRRPPAGLARDALDALRTMNKVVARAVMTEMMRGTADEDLADVFDMDPFTFVRQYGHLNAGHLADDPRAMWEQLRPTCPAAIHDTCPDDPAAAAHHLDEWMHRHLDPREAAPPPPHPVSAGL
ncbi:hypothetical protein GCM10027187_40880 [Streptosporangium sandarakinum]|uniref:Uncharacterized protein n=1 Tax=Streptosporangium sandarakinum TaxID=1260955 RepID=A0A852V916_9ACTN|nr:hypothetical protein [Streptosporangium sandarakinum]NYF44580.1 hypothetical protein [Streptosporangium sandarakinum]